MQLPLTLFLALFLAFAVEGSGPEGPAPGLSPPAWTRAELASRVSETVGGVLLVAVVAFLLGRLVARRVVRQGRSSSLVRWAFSLGTRAVDVLSVVVFGWILFTLEWPRVVHTLLGPGDPILVDDALILLPFILAQAAGWWGLYAGERALKGCGAWINRGGIQRHLWLKARQSLGLVLPVAALYGVGTDVVHRIWPATRNSPWDQPIGLAVMCVVVLSLAPALVRVAWPAHSLPPGPLRDRLEHLARRLGFRCTDILIWDTNRVVVNAGVTGSLPWFRYVILTDALVENLDPLEISAVFGHEIGHIAHRHLLFFAFFLLGSLGALVLADGVLHDILPGPMVPLPNWLTGGTVSVVLDVLVAVVLGGGYLLLVFGYLSRRFERQADIFGCRAVSCGEPECPPHADIDGRAGREAGSGPKATRVPLCPVGIRIFVNALSNVALLNGIRPTAWSWRHGSIAHRIAFLEDLIYQPQIEQRFQTRVRRMRVGLAVLFVAVVGLAVAQGILR